MENKKVMNFQLISILYSLKNLKLFLHTHIHILGFFFPLIYYSTFLNKKNANFLHSNLYSLIQLVSLMQKNKLMYF